MEEGNEGLELVAPFGIVAEVPTGGGTSIVDGAIHRLPDLAVQCDAPAALARSAFHADEEGSGGFHQLERYTASQRKIGLGPVERDAVTSATGTAAEACRTRNRAC